LERREESNFVQVDPRPCRYPKGMDARATTTLKSSYLMTMHAPMAGTPRRIDGELTVYSSVEGWASGPRIAAQIRAPSGDWLRVGPNGSLLVDARVLLETEDSAWISVTYQGVIQMTPEVFERMSAGALFGPEAFYFITTPRFQTDAPRYAWLNHVQAVGKAVQLRGGLEGFVRYDVFTVE